jgi:hypothetical protein
MQAAARPPQKNNLAHEVEGRICRLEADLLALTLERLK